MAAAAATTEPHHRQLKLFINPNARQVVFAEASGEAIEFLHSILVSPQPHVSLPFDLATTRACIGNVYDSVDKLRMFAAAENDSRPPLQRQQEKERYFVCGGDGNGGSSSCGSYVAAKSGAKCPACGGEMTVEVPRGCPGASCSDAYAELTAKGADLTCWVMDDLRVMPAGEILPIFSTFMTSFFVAPGAHQERVVSLGYTEAIEILETSLQSSTVLTDVFLFKKKTRRFGKSPK